MSISRDLLLEPVDAEARGVWITRSEVEAVAEALRQRGYRVTADALLEPLTDGAFVARVVVRACAAAPDLQHEEALEVIEEALEKRGTA